MMMNKAKIHEMQKNAPESNVMVEVITTHFLPLRFLLIVYNDE